MSAVAPQQVLCIRCGYDLSGLAPADPCPECGLPEAVLKAPNLLRSASPGYLETLRRSAKVARACVLWGALSIVCLMIGWATSHTLWLVPGLLGVSAVYLVSQIAQTRLCSIDPLCQVRPRSNTLRVFAKSGCIIGVVLYGVGVPMLFLQASDSATLTIASFIGVGLLLAVVPTTIVKHLLVFLWLHTIAVRIPDTKMRRQSTIAYGCTVCAGVLLLSGALVSLVFQEPLPVVISMNLFVALWICSAIGSFMAYGRLARGISNPPALDNAPAPGAAPAIHSEHASE